VAKRRLKSSSLTLDAGAFIAAQKRSRLFLAALERIVSEGPNVKMRVPAGVVGQVWRGNHALLARMLNASEVIPLDHSMARAAGELLKSARHDDVVDATVVLVAGATGDAVMTSDPEDIARLSRAHSFDVNIIPV
jgi:hypothetical protein